MALDKLTKQNYLTRGPLLKVYSYWYNVLVDRINALSSADGSLTVDTVNARTGMLTGAPILTGGKPASYITFFEDFLTTYGSPDLALASESDPTGVFSEVADRGAWLMTIVDSGTGNTESVYGRPVDGSTNAGAQGGWGEFRTCNADNDAVTCQLNGEGFKLAAGKKLWFETQFFIEDVSESEIFIGLADTGTDLYGAAGVGVNNHVGFILDGDGNLDFSVDEAATQSKSDTGVDFVDGTIATLATANVKHKCGFYWDGVNTVTAYVDDVLKVTKTDNGSTVLIPDGTCLSPGFTILTQGTTDEAIFIDYIYVAQER